MTTVGSRLDDLKKPSPRIDSYGRHECGCTWDSGPFGVYCGKHDPEELVWDALTALHSAANAALGDATHANLAELRAVVADVGRVINEGVDPAT